MPRDYSAIVDDDSPELHLCRCNDCSREADAEGSILGGIYLERALFQSHQKSSNTRVHPAPNDAPQGQRAPAVAGPAQPSHAQGSAKKPGADTDTRPVNDGAKIQKAARDDLEHLDKAITKRVATLLTPKGRLTFCQDPRICGAYVRPEFSELPQINRDLHALMPGTPANDIILDQQNQLVMYLRAVESVPHHNDESIKDIQGRLVEGILVALEHFDRVKELEWIYQRRARTEEGKRRYAEEGYGIYVDCEPYFFQQHHTWHPATLSVFLTVLVLHLFCGLSRRASTLLLAGMQGLMRILRASANFNTIQETPLPSQFPKDVRTVIRSFDLEPRTHAYVCCPQCFALYAHDSCPTTCTYRNTPGSPICDAELHRTRKIRGKDISYPVRTYLHQDMTEWVARLFSRPGVEDFLDAPLKRDPSDPLLNMRDIWDSPTFAQFLGPDKATFFLEKEGSESRLAFALGLDGFNPFGTKAAKQMTSVTGIYMICLNLPPHLRYLPENMYLVGVIPGPSKPSGEQINHFLSLLVDDLLCLWDPGVYLSRTAKHDKGRLVRSVLIPLVCDLLAAKQVTGLSGHQSTFFCTYCLLPLGEIENLDRNSWPRRDFAEHLKLARAWRDAQTPDEQSEIYKKYGVRWSELLRLPYWNPLLFTVIDSMHNLYLGVLKYHCRKLWGMDIKGDDDDISLAVPTAPEPPRPPPNVMKQAEDVLNNGDISKSKFPKAVLFHLCSDRHLRRGTTVNGLLSILKKYAKKRRQKKLRQEPRSVPLEGSTAGEPSSESRDDSDFRTDEHPTQPTEVETHSKPIPTLSEKKNVESARSLLKSAQLLDEKALLYYTKPVLSSLCREFGLATSGNKQPLVSRLMSWRASNKLPVDDSDGDGAPKQDPRMQQENRKKAEQIKIAVSWFNSSPAVSDADLAKLTIPVLKEVCKVHKMKAGGNKPQLKERLLRLKQQNQVREEDRARQPRQDDKGVQIPGPEGRKSAKKAVLGRYILSEVRKDMANTQLPAWVSPAPTGLGTTLHGKLSADQWRTTCLVHLPITLVRLWGDKDGREAQMLSNFVDLIVAVEIGTMRVTSEEHISLYDKYMLRYIKDMTILYPDAKIVPNHHLALHLREFLSSFGSVHAWRAFAFERYNYLLQQENTNAKFGELELTFMRHTCRGANLRPLMQDPVVKETVSELIEAYDYMVGEDRRGTRILDSTILGSDSTPAPLPSHPKETRLDDDAYKAFLYAANSVHGGIFANDLIRRKADEQILSRKVISCPKIFISGVTYKPHASSPKDSNIIFDHEESTRAGKLEQIIRQVDGPLSDEVYLIVRGLHELSEEDAEQDPYRKFPLGCGSLCYDQYDQHVTVVRPTDIVSHFAKTPLVLPQIAKPCVHVLPLNVMVSGETLRPYDEEMPEVEIEAADYDSDGLHAL